MSSISHSFLTILVLSLVVATYGCRPTSSDPQRSEPSRAAEETAASEEASATKSSQSSEHDHEHEHPEGEETAGSEGGDILLETKAVGQPISDEVELVDAATLLENPDQYSGKMVQVKGRVKGFCHHRRAWFAINVPGANPPYLRVVTAPDFLVPAGIMNAEATTVGTVVVQETPRSRVTHYEKEHKLGVGNGDEVGRARRIILKATGAVFSPES